MREITATLSDRATADCLARKVLEIAPDAKWNAHCIGGGRYTLVIRLQSSAQESLDLQIKIKDMLFEYKLRAEG